MPSLIKFPWLLAIETSSRSSFSILSTRNSHKCNWSPSFLSSDDSCVTSACLMGCIQRNDFLSWSISRGLIRLTATLEINLSRSAICLRDSRIFSASVRSLKKVSTMNSRSSMADFSFKGRIIHLRSCREPIGVTVQSRISINGTPPSFWEVTISRFRMVNLSSHTNLSSSMREMEEIWDVSLCSVSSR